MSRSRIGLWFIGAKGGVASTATVGLIAICKGLMSKTGLVSELPPLQGIDLAEWSDFVVGGHEIRDAHSFDEAMRMHTESRAIDFNLLQQCKPELDRINEDIKLGTLANVGATIEGLAAAELRKVRETARATVERLKNDLKSFAEKHGLSRIVMVNVSSTEPAFDISKLPQRWSELNSLLDRPECPLPASSLYAIAALDLGYPYLNFTPSPGATPAAISELAIERGTCHMGYDGKTGETLMKSVLAPMFARRNLHVMSWVGHNIFGNMDGQVLDDPTNKQAKVTSKDRLLGEILGYAPQTLVTIEYIKSMGDWKTAWDHIHFQGFLGTPMTLQFIWQGCDSLLAAPLALDMARLAERAHRQGKKGVLNFLSSFYKSPIGASTQDFTLQYQWLLDWAEELRGAKAGK